MKNLFRKLGAGRKGWHFEEADLTEVTEEFSNPARGWYQIHTFKVEQEPDFNELEWCVNKKDTLVLVLIDIGFFQDRDLDEEALERIGRILRFFADRKYDCIVRAVYDHEGRAMEREPFFFAQVLSHLRQLCGVLEQYADSVFVYQGMLVGNWGEMHTSRFLHEDKLVQMAEVLRSGIGDRMYLAVRRPVCWRILHRSMDGEKLGYFDHMGLFDDGMFGSVSHLGTFGTLSREEASWNALWSREDELAFERELGQYVPNGGEAVYGEGFVEGMTPEGVIRELGQMQVTYLNRVYDAKILGVWKEWGCPGHSVWADKSLFDFVGAHLGYRLLVRKVSVIVKKGNGKSMVEVEVENIGFGGVYQEAELYLESLDEREQSCIVEPMQQMEGWCSGEKRQFSWKVEPGNYELYLAARRKWDGMRIRFANLSDSEGRTFLGRIYME